MVSEFQAREALPFRDSEVTFFWNSEPFGPATKLDAWAQRPTAREKWYLKHRPGQRVPTVSPWGHFWPFFRTPQAWSWSIFRSFFEKRRSFFKKTVFLKRPIFLIESPIIRPVRHQHFLYFLKYKGFKRPTFKKTDLLKKIDFSKFGGL